MVHGGRSHVWLQQFLSNVDRRRIVVLVAALTQVCSHASLCVRVERPSDSLVELWSGIAGVRPPLPGHKGRSLETYQGGVEESWRQLRPVKEFLTGPGSMGFVIEYLK